MQRQQRQQSTAASNSSRGDPIAALHFSAIFADAGLGTQKKKKKKKKIKKKTLSRGQLSRFIGIHRTRVDAVRSPTLAEGKIASLHYMESVRPRRGAIPKTVSRGCV